MRGIIFLCEVDDLITSIIVTCDDETVIRAYQHMTQRNNLHTTVVFFLEIGGVNVVIRKLNR